MIILHFMLKKKPVRKPRLFALLLRPCNICLRIPIQQLLAIRHIQQQICIFDRNQPQHGGLERVRATGMGRSDIRKFLIGPKV